ncbi:anthocyanin 3'-O-beta-glucosyltransferase-like [Musa acuminata AAA Group]|uniref:anthocyanin 3'-O-beta-glucosyltransferase-like n=1 Tax=Musa acuminata AAA Group TaxID=214697 RepID=UPI0031D811B8
MDLHFFFLPFLAPGHMIPMVDLAGVFAGRGVRSTIVTTTANVPLIQPTVDLANADDSLRHPIQILVLSFPSFESGIPLGHENLLAFNDPEVTPEFMTAINMLEDPFKQLLQAHRPDGIVADIFYAWASDAAKEFGIPRLSFHGSNTFCTVVSGALGRLKLHESEQAFDVPGLPHRFQMTWSQLPEFITKPDDSMERLGDGYRKSYGMLVNSFYELESDYIDLVKKGSETKLWHVGPLSLHNQLAKEKAARGNTASISADECLTWLDSKKPRSVLYVCFGSLGQCTATQLHEIALGLEASDHPFIWVVSNAGEPSEWLPERFNERVIGEGKGLLIKGWAPQLLILNHEAVGGSVTHCGWNSCLEGMSAGVPMVTWPLFAEQFFNEKLVVDVLRVGIAVGATVCSNRKEKRALVKAEAIKKAVDELMGSGEEAESRRKRAEKLKELAIKAVAEGGASHMDLSCLLADMVNLKAGRGI